MKHQNMRGSYNKQGERASAGHPKLEAPSPPKVEYVDAPLPTVNPWLKNKTAQNSAQPSQQISEKATSSQSCDKSCDDSSRHNNNNTNDNGAIQNKDKSTSYKKPVECANLEHNESEAATQSTVEDAISPSLPNSCNDNPRHKEKNTRNSNGRMGRKHKKRSRR